MTQGEKLREAIEKLQESINQRNEELVDRILDAFPDISADEINTIESLDNQIQSLTEAQQELNDQITTLENKTNRSKKENQTLKTLKDRHQASQKKIDKLKQDFENKSGRDYDSARSDLDSFRQKRAQNNRDNAQDKRQLRETQKKEREERKPEREKQKKEARAKQKWDIAFDAIKQVVELAFQYANMVAENELSRVKEINDIQKNALQATQKIASTQIKLAGTLFGNSLKTAFASITDGANTGAYAAAGNQIEEVKQAKVASMDIEMQRLQLANKQSMRTKQGQNDRQDRTENFAASAITAGIAVGTAIGSILPGVGTAVGVIIGGVAGVLTTAVKGIFDYRAQQRRREAEFMQSNYELSEAQLENMQQIQKSALEAGMEYVKAAQDFSQKIEDATLRIDDAYRKAGASMGLHGTNLRDYTQRMIDVQTKVAWVGGDKADEKIAQMQRNYNETTGYVNNLSQKDIEKNLSLGVALDDQALANNLTSAMEYFNKSVADSSDIFYEMYTRANKAGISSKKYAKDLQQNLKLAQKYTFQGGSKGMMEMALWAQKVRFNVQSLGSMLDKVNEGGLEGVITQAAQLQVLGGSAAMGADPLAMAWEANNDPEAYAKRMHDMTKDYGVFNEDTGEIDIKGLDAMMLRQIAKVQGRSYEDVRAEVTQRGKSEMIDRQITANYNDDQKQLIYSKAKYNPDTKKWEYTNNDGVTKDINDLSDSDFLEMLPVEERIEDHVKGILTLLQQTAGTTGTAQGMLVGRTYASTEANVNARNEETLTNTTANIDTLAQIIKEQQQRATEALHESNKRLVGSLDMVRTMNAYLKDEAQKLNKTMPDQLKTMNLAINALKGNTEAIKTLQMRATGLDNLSDTEKQRLEGIVSDKTKYTEGANGRKSFILNDKNDSNLFALLENAIGTERTEIVKKLSDKGYGANYEEIRRFYDYLNMVKNGVQDGIAVGAKNGFLAQATKVTPVNDGTANLVQSHPDDTAIFAKTGGPFDKLFNGVFGEISAVHNAMREALQPQPMPLQREEVSDFSPRIIKAMTLGGGSQAQTPTCKNGPIDINISGKLEIAGENGSTPTVDILNELSTNPMFVRALTQLISEEMSRSINVGKASSPY